MQIPRLRFDRVRSYQVLRSAHLERAHDFAPASILYGVRRYDFDETLAVGLDLHRCGPLALVLALLAQPLIALEINEPLQTSGLPRTALTVAAVRIADGLRRRRTRIGAYAIENRDPFAVRPDRLRSRVRQVGESVLSRLISHQLDQIAYGTDGAAELYHRRLGRSLIRASARVFSAVPTACDCPGDGAPNEPDPELVLYLGALHPRKGVRQLLDAWPHVSARQPTARLVLVGKGDLEPEVRATITQLRNVELVIDPPRPQVHQWLRRARTLVLFSQPTPRWREQVGLPIVEGLAHGCRIVTSDQTGLADWLRIHEHQVLPPTAPAGALGQAILLTLDPSPLNSGPLPEVDGRRSADDWLLHTELEQVSR